MLKYGHSLFLLILFLLQGIAPLAHAHVHQSNADQGIHLEGLFSTDFPDKTLGTPSVGSDSITIGIHRFIRQTHSLIPKDLGNTERSDFLRAPTPKLKTAVFIQYFVAFTPPFPWPTPFPSASAPRAPPFSVPRP